MTGGTSTYFVLIRFVPTCMFLPVMGRCRRRRGLINRIRLYRVYSSSHYHLSHIFLFMSKQRQLELTQESVSIRCLIRYADANSSHNGRTGVGLHTASWQLWESIQSFFVADKRKPKRLRESFDKLNYSSHVVGSLIHKLNSVNLQVL